jgi:L-alanine-DL-glutamate epimerase-like enolase superfamily enzyme
MEAANGKSLGRLRMQGQMERWPLVQPFRIAGHTFQEIVTLLVTLDKDGCVGRGEAAGVFYRSETPASMLQQLETLRDIVEAGIDRATLLRTLPPGGARNALDCALWELEARCARKAVWEIAGLPEPRPLLTTLTCGADEPAKMADAARRYAGARAIKLKLTGAPVDADRVLAVRAALPQAWLAVDANQGFDRPTLERLLPTLIEARVAMIEQPFPIGQDAWLDGFESPIPIAADESAQRLADVAPLVGRYEVVNIKLDKCGGLTEGLSMARAARAAGLAPMVGNMGGTSLAMAPAFVLGQLCDFVDLDGPALLASDRAMRVQYVDGVLHCPREVWG